MTKKQDIAAQRAKHHAGLLALAQSINPSNKLTGLALWLKLRRIENEALRATTAQCNGAAFEGQPYRNEEQWEAYREDIEKRVAAVFGGNLPPKFHVNGDARGYALKLDGGNGTAAERATPFDLVTDWGGNQILAPEID
jgi:hypothetical protein